LFPASDKANMSVKWGSLLVPSKINLVDPSRESSQGQIQVPDKIVWRVVCHIIQQSLLMSHLSHRYQTKSSGHLSPVRNKGVRNKGVRNKGVGFAPCPLCRKGVTSLSTALHHNIIIRIVSSLPRDPIKQATRRAYQG